MAIKARRGGKFPVFDARGYYGRNDAGIEPKFNPNTAGEYMEIGTGSRKYTFYSETHGTLTVWADSFEEAWRQAKVRGYSRRKFKR